MGIQEGLKVYISGALHGSRDLLAAREKYESVAELLAQEGFEAYLPHLHTDPESAHYLTPSQVFNHDLKVLSECDAVLAFLDEPSSGVGAEIAIAVQQRKPTIAVCRRGETTSRFIEGLIAASSVSVFMEYDTLGDVVNGVVASLGVPSRK